MSIGMGKDYKELMRIAIGQGWRVEQTRGNHVRWIAPDGSVTFTGLTNSDHRALLNHRARLRRMGLIL